MEKGQLVFQFISEPRDINFGGNVHGGVVMQWIDQTAYACAGNWSETYCVTVYVGGIRFFKPISIGNLVKVEAQIIFTGKTSMHIGVDVYSKKIGRYEFQKTTHCVIVFVAMDPDKKPTHVPPWKPQTERQKEMEKYAIRLMELRRDIEDEMNPFLH